MQGRAEEAVRTFFFLSFPQAITTSFHDSILLTRCLDIRLDRTFHGPIGGFDDKIFPPSPNPLSTSSRLTDFKRGRGSSTSCREIFRDFFSFFWILTKSPLTRPGHCSTNTASSKTAVLLPMAVSPHRWRVPGRSSNATCLF